MKILHIINEQIHSVKPKAKVLKLLNSEKINLSTNKNKHLTHTQIKKRSYGLMALKKKQQIIQFLRQHN
jgi:hypothetical protein